MENVKLVKDYLEQGRVMQLATVREGHPWICTVYFVFDDKLNFYWLSLPTRRHSQEIKLNDKIAITVPVKFDLPVIGIQAEGTANEVSDSASIEPIIRQYVEKYNNGKDFLANFLAGKNQHHMYKFTPSKLFLFDEVNFKGLGRQEINV